MVLFEVPFTSAMSDADLSLLGHELDLWTHMNPKMQADASGPGVARLDHFSGLFLERGADDGMWLLQARTWGKPAPQTVHGWHLIAAQAARRLDPDVSLPEPTAGTAAAASGPGQTGNRRLARWRRRPVGLS